MTKQRLELTPTGLRMNKTADNKKIPLPAFLKLLASNDVSVQKAIVIAGKIYKDYDTPNKLTQLTDVKLTAAGVEKDDRKAVMIALRKAGYNAKTQPLPEAPRRTAGQDDGAEPIAGPSSSTNMSTVQVVTTPTNRKRKRVNDGNEFLPDGHTDEAASYGSLDFNEIVDEEVLKTKFTVVNRAPLMTAWATVVAERMGFRREEALSIASVYTEMNAISKGISIGLFEEGRQQNMEAIRGGSQPYVDLMGRRVPLYRTQQNQWRALSKGTPVQPGTAFSYISRAFRQTTPHVVGALRLLAGGFGPEEVNEKAWALYVEFRPAVDGWGKRSELRCDTILGLRKKPREVTGINVAGEGSSVEGVVKFEKGHEGNAPESIQENEREQKKARVVSLEEYEAALDEEPAFDDIDLDFDTH